MYFLCFVLGDLDDHSFHGRIPAIAFFGKSTIKVLAPIVRISWLKCLAIGTGSDYSGFEVCLPYRKHIPFMRVPSFRPIFWRTSSVHFFNQNGGDGEILISFIRKEGRSGSQPQQ